MTGYQSYAMETDRLFLQQLSAEDHLADYHRLWSSPEAVQWSSSHPKNTVEESKEWMFKETNAFNPKTENFAILLKDSKNDQGELRMIGKVGIFQFPAEISWMLHPDFWGKGYASEAVRGFLDWYWGNEASSDVHSIMADIDPENTASIRIAEKTGFAREKILKDAYTTASKGVRDLAVYRLLRPKLYVAETKRLYLQETSIEKHLHAIHAWNSLPNGMEWSSASRPTCLQDTINWMHARTRVSDARIENYAILLKPSVAGEEPELVGVVGVIRFPAEIGYKIMPQHQGKGYISEALPAFMQLFWGLKTTSDINEVLAEIDPTNEASKKVAKKAGFTYRDLIKIEMATGPRELECWVIKRPRWVAESERLVYEIVDVEKHLAGGLEMWKHAAHFDYLGHRPPCETLEDAREMLVPRSTSIDKPHIRNLAVLLKSPDPATEPEMIGIVGIPRWPPGLWAHLQAGKPLDTFRAQGELDAPEMGYGINMKHWGKGYTSEAAGAFLKYFWSLTENHHQQINKVVAWIQTDNDASRRVLEKNGFKKEKQLSLVEDGSPVDLTIFATYRPQL